MGNELQQLTSNADDLKRFTHDVEKDPNRIGDPFIKEGLVIATDKRARDNLLLQFLAQAQQDAQQFDARKRKYGAAAAGEPVPEFVLTQMSPTDVEIKIKDKVVYSDHIEGDEEHIKIGDNPKLMVRGRYDLLISDANALKEFTREVERDPNILAEAFVLDGKLTVKEKADRDKLLTQFLGQNLADVQAYQARQLPAAEAGDPVPEFQLTQISPRNVEIQLNGKTIYSDVHPQGVDEEIKIGNKYEFTVQKLAGPCPPGGLVFLPALRSAQDLACYLFD